MICAMYGFASSQEIIYVSANGNDNNSGLSETEALKTLFRALSRSEQLNSSKITVLGTLDANSETQYTRDSVFQFSVNSDREILITGKPDASGSEKAILSAKDSNRSVVSVHKGNIRFEHIEISNANGESTEGTGAVGIFVFSRATLGQGAVVRDNNGWGILVSNNDAICTIDGGEVRNNNSTGVFINRGLLVLKNGTIADNKAGMGAGVIVAADTKFEMSGGTITKNRATDYTGGVWVLRGGKFVQNRKAKVSGNNAAKSTPNPNVYRQ